MNEPGVLLNSYALGLLLLLGTTLNSYYRLKIIFAAHRQYRQPLLLPAQKALEHKVFIGTRLLPAPIIVYGYFGTRFVNNGTAALLVFVENN